MRDRFWEVLCPHVEVFTGLFLLSVVLLVLQLLSLPFVETDTATYYVSVITIVVLALSIVGTGVVVRKCRGVTRGAERP